MDIESILNVVYIISSIVITSIPFLISLIKTIKRKKQILNELNSTTSDLERQKLINLNNSATIEMFSICKQLIVEIEKAYENSSMINKSSLKKQDVLSKLNAYCDEHNVSFDVNFWSKTIDELISMTKQVNVK